jgi:hypothetical protein
MPTIRRIAEKTFKRKIIGTGSAGARCCFRPLAEYLMLQKYLDLRSPVVHMGQHDHDLNNCSRRQ